jgi:glycosyltransferase involved in cell wall biosynthesis
VRRERIVVAKYGIGKGFGVADVDNVARVRERYALDSSSVLFVGTPLVRRNLAALSRAIDEIRSILPDVGLYGVGPETKRVGSVNNLRWLGYVPEEDLAAVYNAATVVAYPSTYEGFGFPVLEALACGTPVVASAAGSLPEIFAGKAWLVDDRHEQWVEALGTLLKDANERQRRIDKAQPWALAQTWDATGRVVHRLLRDASQENGNYNR